jgi:hypothetical protein
MSSCNSDIVFDKQNKYFSSWHRNTVPEQIYKPKLKFMIGQISYDKK